MKEYKMFKSSTLKSIELPGNSQLIFDLANKNKTNVCLTANLYTSRYSFPLSLRLIQYINDDNITKFGKGTYLNVLYTLVKDEDDAILRVIHNGIQEEEFEYLNESVSLENNEVVLKYYYSKLTTNYIIERVENNITTQYELNLKDVSIIFENSSDTTLKNNKISINSKEDCHISIEYNSDGSISKLIDSSICKEEVEFGYTNSLCTKLIIRKKDDSNNNKKVSQVDLNYVNSIFVVIKEKYDENTTYSIFNTFNYGNEYSFLEVKNAIDNKYVCITFEGNVDSYFVSEMYDSTTDIVISYRNDYRTDYYVDNYCETYNFNENYDLLSVSDNEGLIKLFKYDVSNKFSLLSESYILKKSLSENGKMIEEGSHEYPYSSEHVIDNTCPGGTTCLELELTEANSSAKIYYDVKGSKFDTYSFILWCKLSYVLTENLSINACIKFLKNNNIVESIISEDIDLKLCHGDWFCSIGLAQAKRDYDEIIFELTPSVGVGDIIFINLGLYKDSLCNVYKYNNKGQLIESFINNNKKIFNYDQNNNLQINNYTINSYYKKRIFKSIDYRGIDIKYGFSNNGNLCSKKINDLDGQYLYEKSCYKNDEFLIYSENVNGEVVENGYSDMQLVESKINDIDVTSYEYYQSTLHYGLLKASTKKVNEVEIYRTEYEYDSFNNIKSITSSKGEVISRISYTYDTLNRITDVHVKQGTDIRWLYHATYDSNGNVNTIHYGDEDNVYSYAYDPIKGRLLKVFLNNELLYEYTYNYGAIEKEKYGTIERKYVYDSKKLKEVDLLNNTVKIQQSFFDYDENNSVVVNQEKSQYYGLSNEYVDSSSLKEDNQVGLEYYLLSQEDNLYFSLMNERINHTVNKETSEDGEVQYTSEDYDISGVLLGKQESIAPYKVYNVDKVGTYYSYYNHGLRFLNVTNSIISPSYDFKGEQSLKDEYSISFGFILNNSLEDKNLVQIIQQRSSQYGGYDIIKVVCESGSTNKLKVRLISYNIREEIEVTSSNLLNDFHFMTLNVKCEKIMETNKFEHFVDVYFDGEYVNSLSGNLVTQLQYVKFLGNDTLNGTITVGAGQEGKLTSIIVSKDSQLSENRISQIYKKLKNIYDSNGIYNKSFDLSINYSNLDHDYISFNNSLNSIQGLTPSLFMMNNNDSDYYNENFKYDSTLYSNGYGKNVYIVKKQLLEYNLPLTLDGTIGLKFKFDNEKLIDLITLKDTVLNYVIKLSSLQNEKLNLSVGSLSKQVTLSYNTWNDFVVTWSRAAISSSLDDLIYTFKFYFNGELLLTHTETLANDFSLILMKIGDNESSYDGNVEVAYLDKIIYSNIGDVNITSFRNKMNNYSYKVNEYDNLGRLDLSRIENNNKNITKNISYLNIDDEHTSEEIDNRLTMLVRKENLTSSNITKYVEYIYTADGKIDMTFSREENLSTSVVGSSILKYDYDDYGRLETISNVIYDLYLNATYHELRKYEYDLFGNITKYYESGTVKDTFEYDGVLLKKHNENSFNYNGLYLSSIVDSNNNVLKEFTWYNKRLTKLVDYENEVILDFTYNSSGLRQSKKVSSLANEIQKDIWYYYNVAGKLISEKCNVFNSGVLTATNITTYLFDYNNQLYGFTYNGNKYFYDIDLLGNINGIFDSNCNLVAKYIYDNDYGKHRVGYANGSPTVIESFIGNVNNIRYKGYYYDVETGLAMVGQRYYSPELCRFIQPSDVSSLNPSSINGLNLYSYANNNPVGIAYSSSSVGGITSARMVSSVALSGISNAGQLGGLNSSGGSGFLGNLISGASSIFSLLDGVNSYLGGTIDALINYIKIPKFNSLHEELSLYSKWLRRIGIGLELVTSAYSNYKNDDLTSNQKWASFGADVCYIAAKSGLSYLAGELVTKGSIAIGSSVACSLVGASIGGVTITFGGAIIIGACVVGVGIVAGTVVIAILSNLADNWWESKKEEWFH